MSRDTVHRRDAEDTKSPFTTVRHCIGRLAELCSGAWDVWFRTCPGWNHSSSATSASNVFRSPPCATPTQPDEHTTLAGICKRMFRADADEMRDLAAAMEEVRMN